MKRQGLFRCYRRGENCQRSARAANFSIEENCLHLVSQTVEPLSDWDYFVTIN